jgi:hypothetical protein
MHTNENLILYYSHFKYMKLTHSYMTIKFQVMNKNNIIESMLL